MCERDSRWDYSYMDSKPEACLSDRDQTKNESNRSAPVTGERDACGAYDSSVKPRSRSPSLSGRHRYRSPSPRRVRSPLPRHSGRGQQSRHSPSRRHSARSPSPRHRISSPSPRHSAYSTLPRHSSHLSSPNHGSSSPLQRHSVRSPSPRYRSYSPSSKFRSRPSSPKYRSRSPSSAYNYQQENKDYSCVEGNQQNFDSNKEKLGGLFLSLLGKSGDPQSNRGQDFKYILQQLSEKIDTRKTDNVNYLSHLQNSSVNNSNEMTYFKDNVSKLDSYSSHFSNLTTNPKGINEGDKSESGVKASAECDKFQIKMPPQINYSDLYDNTTTKQWDQPFKGEGSQVSSEGVIKDVNPVVNNKEESCDITETERLEMLYQKYEKELQELSSQSGKKAVSSENNSVVKNNTDIAVDFPTVKPQQPSANKLSTTESSAVKSDDFNRFQTNQNSQLSINSQPLKTDFQHVPLVSYPNQSQTLAANYKGTSMHLQASCHTQLNRGNMSTPMSSLYHLPQVAYPQVNNLQSSFVTSQQPKYPAPSPVLPPQPVPPVTNPTSLGAVSTYKSPLAVFSDNSLQPQSRGSEMLKESEHSYPSELKPNYASNLSRIALDILKETQQSRLKTSNEKESESPLRRDSSENESHPSWIKPSFKEPPNMKRFRPDQNESYLHHEGKKKRLESDTFRNQSYMFRNQSQNSKRSRAESYMPEKNKWRNHPSSKVSNYPKMKEFVPASSSTSKSSEEKDIDNKSDSFAVPSVPEQVSKSSENKEMDEKQNQSSKAASEKKAKATTYDPKVQAANALLNKIRKKQNSALKKKQENDTSNESTEAVKECPLCHNIPKSKISMVSKECQAVPSINSQNCQTTENDTKTQESENLQVQSIATLCRFDGSDEHPWVMYYSRNPWRKQIRPVKGVSIPLSLGGGFTKSEFLAAAKNCKTISSELKSQGIAAKKDETSNDVTETTDVAVNVVKENISLFSRKKVQLRYNVSTLCRFDGDDEHPWIMYFSKNPWHKQASSIKGVPIPFSLGGGIVKPKMELMDKITDEETVSLDDDEIDDMLMKVSKPNVQGNLQHVSTLCRFDGDDEEPWVMYFSRNQWRKQVRPTKGVPIPFSLGGGFKKSEFLSKATPVKNDKNISSVSGIIGKEMTVNENYKDTSNPLTLVKKDEMTSSVCKNSDKALITINNKFKKFSALNKKQCSVSTLCRFEGNDKQPWIIYCSKNPWHKQVSSTKGAPIPFCLGAGFRKPNIDIINKINTAKEEEVCSHDEEIEEMLLKANKPLQKVNIQHVATLCRYEDDDEEPWLMYFSRNAWRKQVRPIRGNTIPFSLGGGFTKSDFIAMSKSLKIGIAANFISNVSKEAVTSNKEYDKMSNLVSVNENKMLNIISKDGSKVLDTVDKEKNSSDTTGKNVQWQCNANANTLSQFDGNVGKSDSVLDTHVNSKEMPSENSHKDEKT